jgi:hypothetical protein
MQFCNRQNQIDALIKVVIKEVPDSVLDQLSRMNEKTASYKIPRWALEGLEFRRRRNRVRQDSDTSSLSSFTSRQLKDRNVPQQRQTARQRKPRNERDNGKLCRPDTAPREGIQAGAQEGTPCASTSQKRAIRIAAIAHSHTLDCPSTC